MARWAASAKWAEGPALDDQRDTPLGLGLNEGLGRTGKGTQPLRELKIAERVSFERVLQRWADKKVLSIHCKHLQAVQSERFDLVCVKGPADKDSRVGAVLLSCGAIQDNRWCERDFRDLQGLQVLAEDFVDKEVLVAGREPRDRSLFEHLKSTVFELEERDTVFFGGE